MRSSTAVYICGGDYTPGSRDDCLNPLHNWPLPAGYVDRAEQAARRLRNRWHNVRCPDCGRFGWRPGKVDPKIDKEVTPYEQ